MHKSLLVTKWIMIFNKMKLGDETSNIFIYKSVLIGEREKWTHSKQFYKTKSIDFCSGLCIGREGKRNFKDNPGFQVGQFDEYWCQL